MIHEKRTSARMAEVIDAARGLKLADARENANVRDAIEGFDVESRRARISRNEARLESECFVRLRKRLRRDATASPAQVAWKKAREASDFPAYAPILQDMFALKARGGRDDAARRLCCGRAYDGALDAFERGMTASRLDSIFAATREGLEPLLKAVLAKKRDAPRTLMRYIPLWPLITPGWETSTAPWRSRPSSPRR